MLGAIVIMGVSGSGKSTLGVALAKTLGCPFLEGDSFHAPAAIAKMRAGHPLDDADR
ncbi:gluconokinase [Sphingomonas sp. NBWT7]|uniref:gluconokinase n=1 Tax=Sphingomonas sp. NBWT7 TaxID=2596913 RepID=UPI0027E57741|nr:gluconokinase [Sphingomonas sp. NBWT7]